MKLLLHADVPRLGHLGDVVEVSSGYARNYLLPQRLAVKPTQANIKAIEAERIRQMELRRLARQEKVNAAEKVDGAEVTIAALANEQGHLFGSVGEDDIAAALQAAGYEVKSTNVELSEHIRMLGTFDVKLQFGEDIGAAVTVQVVLPEDEEGGDQSERQSDSARDIANRDG